MPLIDLTDPENAPSNSSIHHLSQTALSRSAFSLAETRRTSAPSVAQLAQ
jgi:hypothetical protein